MHMHSSFGISERELIYNSLAYHNIITCDFKTYNLFKILPDNYKCFTVEAILITLVQFYSMTERELNVPESSIVAIKMNKEFRNNRISNVHAYSKYLLFSYNIALHLPVDEESDKRVWHTINTLTHKPADECTRVLYHLTSAATERNM